MVVTKTRGSFAIPQKSAPKGREQCSPIFSKGGARAPSDSQATALKWKGLLEMPLKWLFTDYELFAVRA